MKGLDTQIQIPSILGEEKKVLDILEETLQHTGCAEADRMDLKTATAEACINAIEHGNRSNPFLNVTVKIQINQNTATVEVYDIGKGAKLKEMCRDENKEKQSCRGWGLFLIERLVDDWEYFYEMEQGLFCFRMKKKIG